jgi:hypothetical protein
VDGYRRPELHFGTFHDSSGRPIPYGDRWEGVPADDLPYSVATHPERFAPLHEVARALAEALPEPHRAGGRGVPIDIELTDFPGVMIRVGDRGFSFPDCGCDACDDDVEQVVSAMEELVEAVVAGRWQSDASSFRYWGEWGSRAGESRG